MSQPFPKPSSAMRQQAPSEAKATHEYALASELARLSLPEASQDVNRRLAWVNSICLLFLAIGVMGLKAPRVIEKPLSEVQDIVPVVYIPPEEPPKIEPDRPPDQPEQTSEAVDTPQVVTVVAANPAAAAFAVPVEGPVILAPVKFASAPPPPKPAAPKIMRFTGTDGGIYPEPNYPRAALEQRQQGTVTLLMTVDSKGNVTSVEIKRSSGYSTLDRHASQWVQKNYKFLPIDSTENRLVEHDVVFQLR
ncbi:MAG: energy transducer TonB [Verrucomicrobia bacterium]|nr:energy transducer TonB [Verrucomicrobiota bacterium]